MFSRAILLIIIFIIHASLVFAQDFSGNISSESWLFLCDAIHPGQKKHNLSFATQAEFYHEWENHSNFTFKPFFRYDLADSKRTHFDIRELNYMLVKDKWELTIGFDKVFWGVTEFAHFVDIINQTDLVESIDLEEKLGQPMLHLSVPRDWGIVELFVLPFFQERTFPGAGGRLRFPVVINTGNTKYESSAKKNHIDWAIRYSHSLGNWDVGISNFYGTSREPTILYDTDAENELTLSPYYELINQTGIDLQLIAGNWLFKLESYYRIGQGDNFYAAVGGFEHTFVRFAGTKMDLGIIGEFAYDHRGEDAFTYYENDAMFGIRLGLNDLASTEILIGASMDTKNFACVGILEASRRISSNWKITATGRIFFNFPSDDIFYGMRKDDFLQLGIAYYF